MWKKNIFIIVIIVTLSIAWTTFATQLFAQDQYALSYGFLNLSDVINTDTYEAPSNEHHVSFTLPFNSDPIRDIDNIRIYLPEFSDITAPTLITGDYAGFPIASASGKYVTVTGIRVQPGGYLSIEGITATNPDSENKFQVTVMVTDGDNLSLIKNIGNTIATINRGSVSVTASIEAELSSLVITGYTSPFAFVIFSEDDAILGTDVSNSLGQFYKPFSGLNPTTHNITFYSVDVDGLVSSAIPLSIYTPAYLETTISNQLLSPSVEISSASFTSGTDLIASGSAIPGGQITLFTDSPLRSYVASASASGAWTYAINDTDEYVVGDYRLFTLASATGGLQSLTSPSLFFSIISSDSVGSACGDITQGDLNCDASVNLADFSILMYYWGTTNAAADINNDGFVNLTDFSILMYYWGT